MPDWILLIIKLVYTASVVWMAAYGLACLALVLLYHFGRKTRPMRTLKASQKDLPAVTIQLPVYNESQLMRRLLNRIAALEYPRDRLQVQVLDDSTDDTPRILEHWVSQIRGKGLEIGIIHREDRRGFKAGALRNGLSTATGELIAIFDADFAPPKNWLLRATAAFDDPRVGCVQTRWGFSNAQSSPLTRAIALSLNGHFLIEQAARSNHHLMLGFNGTAGMWRRACIEDAGGWQDDTLTEDLDLSYRAQLRGWRIRFLPDIVVPSLLPDQLDAFKKQQYRWAKGSMQTARKIYPGLMRAKIPETTRLMGLIHLGGYAASLCMLLSFLALIPLGLYAPAFFRLFPFTVISSLGPPLLYLSARSKDFPTLPSRLAALAQLILIGYGISLNNAIAVLDGLVSRDVGEFVRTPKTKRSRARKDMVQPNLRRKADPMAIAELALALIAIMAIDLLSTRLGCGIVPWLMLYAGGYGYMASGIFSESIILPSSQPAHVSARQRVPR